MGKIKKDKRLKLGGPKCWVEDGNEPSCQFPSNATNKDTVVEVKIGVLEPLRNGRVSISRGRNILDR